MRDGVWLRLLVADVLVVVVVVGSMTRARHSQSVELYFGRKEKKRKRKRLAAREALVDDLVKCVHCCVMLRS